MSSSWKEPTTAIFKDTSYFIDWKKYHLCMVPHLDLDLDKGVHTLLTTHLSTVLRESHSAVRDSIQFTVDQVLGQHHQAVKTQQKLKASLSVAVNSILTIVTGSTDGSFRKTCLQALQAADTQEFGTKLHKVFHEITQHRFLHQGPCDRKQPSPQEKDSAPRTQAAREHTCPERSAVGGRRQSLLKSAAEACAQQTLYFRSGLRDVSARLTTQSLCSEERDAHGTQALSWAPWGAGLATGGVSRGQLPPLRPLTWQGVSPGKSSSPRS
nr:type 2 DNA topoisomerase 6 subunit B-like isoform X3 [Oryctolagus cuniculus]